MAAIAQHNQHLYDSAAGLKDSTSAIKSRAGGAGIQLKTFHNAIKRTLIMQFGLKKERLLDMGCGRGGDIAKWIDAKLSYVKGFDLSPASVKEAQERLKFYTIDKTGAPKTNVRFIAEFAEKADLGTKEFKDALPYDCVTSMFTLHYFFEQEATLKQFLHNVSINLKNGGVFFGCVPDGKRVLTALGSKRELKSPFLNIARHFEGGHQSFGSAYTCAIGDTVTNGEEGGSLEFLVFRTPLESLAERYGLKPIVDYGPMACEQKGAWKTWNDFFDQTDKNAVLKHFAPKFSDADASLSQASQLFCAFAFQKVTDYGSDRPTTSITEKRHVNKKRRLPNSGANAGSATEFAPLIEPSVSVTPLAPLLSSSLLSPGNSALDSKEEDPVPQSFSDTASPLVSSSSDIAASFKPKKRAPTANPTSKPKKPKPHPLFRKRKEQLKKLTPAEEILQGQTADAVDDFANGDEEGSEEER